MSVGKMRVRQIVFGKMSLGKESFEKMSGYPHWRHKHKHKIDKKTKDDLSSGTCKYKTNAENFSLFRLFFCSWLKPGSHDSISIRIRAKQKAKQRNEVKPAR